MGVSSKRFSPLFGIHFCTAILNGRHISPNRIKAANGLKITAKNQVMPAPSGLFYARKVRIIK